MSKHKDETKWRGDEVSSIARWRMMRTTGLCQ